MNLLRAVSRPLLAAPFIADGVDALVRPKRHVEKLEATMPLLKKAGVAELVESQATLITRVTGAVTTVAGVGLMTGRAPRSCATVLALVNVPLALVNHPVWAAKGKEQRSEVARGLAQRASLGAGLVLAAVDREGKPSLAWRHQNRREQRAALEAAQEAVAKTY